MLQPGWEPCYSLPRHASDTYATAWLGALLQPTSELASRVSLYSPAPMRTSWARLFHGLSHGARREAIGRMELKLRRRLLRAAVQWHELAAASADATCSRQQQAGPSQGLSCHHA